VNEKPDREKQPSKGTFFAPPWREVSIVLAAGAVGGFASWVYGIVLSQEVPGGAWSMPISIFLGAFAAGVGVYVLTNTNTSAVARTMFFAALCGFVWKPVCDAGRAFIAQTIQQRQDAAAEEAGNEAAELADSLAKTPPDQLPAKLEQINEASLAALEALPYVNNSRVRRSVESKVNTALTKVAANAPKAPQAASGVIQSVGKTAARTRSVRIADSALASLDHLAQTNRAFAPAQIQLRTNILEAIAPRFLNR